MSGSSEQGPGQLRMWIGLIGGPMLAVLIHLVGPPPALAEAVGGAAQADKAWIVLCLLLVMAVWWITEAIPIPVTALLPMLVLPFFGVRTMSQTSADYMHPIVVLLMGGFIFAKTIERWNLHARIALNVVARAGNHPTALVGGFMVAAALLSMWISNTATAIMMTPIALSVAAAVAGRNTTGDNFARALLLGIAYACSIGGLGTPVGTPTNLIVMGYLNQNAGYAIDFQSWMMLGVPAVLVLLPVAWFVLTRWSFNLKHLEGGSGAAEVREQLSQLGAITMPEIRTLMLFVLVASLWIFKAPLQGLEWAGVRPFAGLSDQITAILGVVLAFLIPAGGRAGKGQALLDWRTAESIPWGVVLLFGGGMALAGAITATGLGTWLGQEVSAVFTMPVIVLMLLITAIVVFATEVTSNVATASALMPVIGAAALATGLDLDLLAAPLALAASCAFMLPMATGPNAVAYATGRVSVPAMAAAGFRLNLVAIPIITVLVYLLSPMAFPVASGG